MAAGEKPAQSIVVQLVPDNPDLIIELDAPAGGATIAWLKEELCQQDPTGEATPASFFLGVAGRPNDVLKDEVLITDGISHLVLLADGGASEADEAPERQAAEEKLREEELRKEREAAEQRARDDDERKRKEDEKRRKEEEDRRLKEDEERSRKEQQERSQREEEERRRREEESKEEAKKKAMEFFAERKAKEEAAERAKAEEAERQAAEEAKRKAREEADREAKAEMERKATDEAERRAKEEADKNAREEAERKAREEERTRKDAAGKKAAMEGLVQRARSAARASAVKAKTSPGTVKVQVAFKYRGQAWTHTFEVEAGSVVQDLKQKMMAKAPEEADWFELQKTGRRINDLDAIISDQSLGFAYLGPKDGPRLAARDLERKAAEEAGADATDRAKAQANSDVEVKLVVKRGVWEEKQIAVSIRPSATIANLRRAVAETLNEELARVQLYDGEEAYEPEADDEPIGARRTFRVKCVAAEGQTASTQDMWQAADNLKWFAWHELWHAAYTVNAGQLEGTRRADMLRRAQEDAKMSSEHYQAVEEKRSVPQRLLRFLRTAAESAGQAVGDAVTEYRSMEPTDLKAVVPPEDVDEDLWRYISEALGVAASEVVYMLSHESRKEKISDTKFHPAWQKVVGKLCSSASADDDANKGSLDMVPLVFGTELKWFIWNEVWRAANYEYGQRDFGPKGTEKQGKAEEDGKRAEGHFQAMQAMGTLSDDTLRRIKNYLESAGEAAATAGLSERSLAGDDIQPTVAPSESEVSPRLWAELTKVVHHAAASVAENIVGETINFIRGRARQADFEIALRRICDPPHVEVPCEDNKAAKPMTQAGQLKRLIPTQVAIYKKDHLLGPIPALSGQELATTLQDFQRYEGRALKQNRERLFNAHILTPFMHKLACNPVIAGAAASVLGSDTVFLHSSTIHISEPGKVGLDESDGHWHSDTNMWNEWMGSIEHFVTVFVALTPCARASGCADFFLGQGQPRPIELQPGQICMYHPRVWYQMKRNGSKTRRDLVILRYISGEVRDYFAELREGVSRDMVLLVSGQDLQGHFKLLPAPSADIGGSEQQRWNEVRQRRMARWKKLL